MHTEWKFVVLKSNMITEDHKQKIKIKWLSLINNTVRSKR